MKKLVKMINSAGRHISGRITRRAADAIGSHLLIKKGASSGIVALCNAATDDPLGVAIGAADTAGEPMAIELLTAPGTKLGVLAEDGIKEGDVLCPALGGKLQKTPIENGTYYEVARALGDGDEDDVVEIETFAPRKVTIAG